MQETLCQSLHDAFVSALMKVRSLNLLLSDMYVRLSEGENASLIIYDDSDNELHVAPLETWNDWRAGVSQDQLFEETVNLLTQVIDSDDLTLLFEETEYNGPFSLLLVDDQMNVLAELLNIDKENILLGDDFWQKMDRELDEFYEKLMSDIRFK